MWSKIAGSFKRQDEPSSSASQGDVMSRVLEQHPNLSVFHPESSSPPASPSKKKSVFKRFSKAPDASLRPDSPNIMKKVKATFNSAANSSQLSLAASTVMQGSIRSSSDALRRPSLDMLRSTNDENEPSTPNIADTRFGSSRSILRQPNTPGTGQNVRFFSRDAYKVISPNQSLEVDQQGLAGMLASADTEFPPRASSLRAEVMPTEIPRAASNNKSRPTVAEVFSPLREQEATEKASPDVSFDLQELDMLSFPPPGLGIDLEIPPFDSSLGSENSGPMSSTPYRDVKGKGKEKQTTPMETIPVAEESIFHLQTESARLPTMSHDRSNSFSFGQTMFFSMDNSAGGQASNRSSAASVDRSLSSISESPASTRATDSPVSVSSTKSRSRALSDTVFQSMIRSASRISNNTNSTHNSPESDINDESSTDLVVYARPTPEPDPFRADANTYYTPQTMIPVTPPRSQSDTVATAGHTRKASKEESLIYSLQAQLTVQSELVGQYETDLRARDEVVEILGKKLSSLEKDETKRKGALRAWKKKVAELEKVCRYLEEEVEGSRQESMERSVMDEASGEALRMLHRQIAQLEREKSDWMRKEEVLREEVDQLEEVVKEKNDEVGKLKDALWKRDESERELKDGIKEAREQMEMMGNVSVGLIDEEELKKISQRVLPPVEAKDHVLAAAEWEEQRAELILTIENLQGEKTTLQLEVQGLTQQLNERDDEYKILKSELEAQWSHTEQNTVKTEALENEVRQLELERETMKGVVDELEERLNSMEVEWNACEDRRAELENEAQELWATNQELENEHAVLEEQLRREQDDVTHLNELVAQRDARIEDLDKEHQFALENIERLENNLRQRDAEAEEYSQRIMERESEAEHLREEMNSMKREHARVVDEQNRALQDVASRQGEDKMHIELALKQKTEADVEARMSKERVSVLTEEVERLRRQVHDLQQESADREVRLVQANKQIAQAQEDNQGLNIALDSKQQELELLKRKHGVRGTAGSTPAQPSKVGHHRRESSVFSTPINSRPPSVMSDSGKEDKAPGSIKAPAALARSNRVNALTVTKPRVEGSMGPPPMKPRPSIATPTPAARAPSLSRSSSAKPASTAPVNTPFRRTSSASETSTVKTKIARITSPSPIPDEKENFETPAKVKRRSMIPTPA